MPGVLFYFLAAQQQKSGIFLPLRYANLLIGENCARRWELATLADEVAENFRRWAHFNSRDAAQTKTNRRRCVELRSFSLATFVKVAESNSNHCALRSRKIFCAFVADNFCLRANLWRTDTHISREART